VLQVGEGEGAPSQAGVGSHRLSHGALRGGRARGELVEGDEDVENLVVEREQLHFADRARARDARFAPVDRIAPVAHAADDHERPAALEHEQQLALDKVDGLLRGGPPGERVAAPLGALDLRELGELLQAPGR